MVQVICMTISSSVRQLLSLKQSSAAQTTSQHSQETKLHMDHMPKGISFCSVKLHLHASIIMCEPDLVIWPSAGMLHRMPHIAKWQSDWVDVTS